MSLFHAGLQPALDSNGNPISGATWTFYLFNTLTPTPVYADDELTTSLGSSEEANGAGRFAVMFLDDDVSTRAILRDAGGTTIKDINPVNGANSGQETNLLSYIPVPLHGDILDRTSTDDVTEHVQTAIDQVAAVGGGTIIIPDGLYNWANVIIEAGVNLRSLNSFYNYLAGSPTYGVKVKMVAGQTGWVIDTPATTTQSCSIEGIAFEGSGAGTSVGGVRFRDTVFAAIKNCSFHDFSEQGFLDVSGVLTTAEDLETVNCLLDITRAAKAGTVEFQSGGADHQIHRIEATASRSTVTDANLYCCAILIGATNCDVSGIRGQISDVGVHVSGALNRFMGGRADLNAGHGWEVTGGGNIFVGSIGLSNSQGTTNTHDNWLVSGTNNQFDSVMGHTLTAKLPRYNFNDTSAVSAANKNRWVNALPLGAAGTANFNQTAGNAAAMALWPRGGAKTLTPDSATPAVDAYEVWSTLNTVPTTITNFTGGVNGQTLVIMAGDANTTIQHNGTTIVTPSATSMVLKNGYAYTFVKNGAWRLISVQTGAAVADAAAATYVAPAGGATVDAESRTAIAQLAADNASMRTQLNAALARLRTAGVILT